MENYLNNFLLIRFTIIWLFISEFYSITFSQQKIVSEYITKIDSLNIILNSDLKKIIELLEVYPEGHSSENVEDFTIWLNNTLFSSNSGGDHSTHDELVLAFKLMFLNKELKKQTKNILSKSSISSIDEYSFLLHLD